MPDIIAIGADHAGSSLKERIKQELSAHSYPVEDFGTHGTDSVDYPDFAKLVALAVQEGKAEYGILICGSGIGMSIAANRFPGIRAAVCHSVEAAKLARAHNNANVLALGARLMDEATALACVEAFLSTPFEGGRHTQRVAKLS